MKKMHTFNIHIFVNILLHFKNIIHVFMYTGYYKINKMSNVNDLINSLIY